MKWQGFFLSDHIATLKNAFNRPKITPKPKQTLELISNRSRLSWEYKKTGILQLDQITNNYEITQLEGWVRGFNANVIVLENNEGKLIKIELEQIRNCSLQ